MKVIQTNPFVYKRALRPGRDNLVMIDRTALLGRTIASLKFGHRLSVLCAKKSGKTSFLLQLMDKCGATYPSWHFISLRAEDFRSSTVKSLLNVIVRKLRAELYPDQPKQGQLSNRNFQSLLLNVARNLVEEHKLILIFDGLDRAPRDFMQMLLRELVKLFQAQDTNAELEKIQVVISASVPHHELRLNNGFSFAEISKQVTMTDFEYDDVHGMIQGVVRRYELPCEDGFVRLLYDMTSGTGYLIQKICYNLFEEACLKDKRPAFSIANGQDAINKIIHAGETHLAVMIEEIESRDSYVEALSRVMRHGSVTSYRLDPDLQALVSIGAVSYKNGAYRIRNRIFESIFQEYFTAERLANRYYADRRYQQAREFFFDAISRHNDTRNVLDNLLLNLKKIDESTGQGDFVKQTLKVFIDAVDGAQACGLLVRNKETNRMSILDALGFSNEFASSFELVYGEGVAGLVAQTGRTRWVRDVTDEVECPEFVARDVAQKLNIGAMVSLPMQSSGEVLAVINLCLRKPYQFSQSQIKMLEVMAAHVAMAWQNHPLRESLGRNEKYLRALNDSVTSLDAYIDAERVFENILSTVQLTTGLEKIYIVWKDNVTDEWQCYFPEHFGKREHALRPPDVGKGEGIAHLVLSTGQPYLIHDVKLDKNYFEIWQDVCFEYGTPLTSQGEIVGCLVLSGSEERALADIETVLFSTLSTLASLTINKERLYRIAEKRTQEVITLRSIDDVISNEKKEAELLDFIAGECLKIVGWSDKTAFILLRDDVREKLVVKGIKGKEFGDIRLDRSLAPLKGSLLSRALQKQKPLFIEKSEAKQDSCVLNHGAQSEIVVPLVFQGETLGAIDVLSRQPGDFDKADLESLKLLANNAAVAIRVNELCNKRLLELRALYRIGTKISASLTEGDIVQTICKEALETIGNENRNVSVQWLQSGNAGRIIKLVQNTKVQDNRPIVESLEQRPLLKRTLACKRHVLVPNIAENSRYVPQDLNMASAVLVPIVFGNRALGAIVMESRFLDDFGEDEVKLLEGLANQAGVALENAHLSTDLSRTQRRLANALEKVAINEALAGMMHDIKNIAAQISGETYWIKKQEDEKRLDSRELCSSIEKINTCVGKIEEFSDKIKNQAYSLQPELKLKNLKEAMSEACDLVATKALRSAIEIRWSGQAFEIPLWIDVGRLARAFFNIMTNAIDAMPRGGLLDIEVRKRGQEITVSFRDTGVGIKREALNKVVSPFTTTKKSGYGLGLAITKHIVETDHKGELKLESVFGKGTSVLVTLPLRSDSPKSARRQMNNSKGKAIGPKNNLPREGRVLVVNDEKDMLEKIRRKLKSEGLIVTGTEFGRKALGLCKRDRFDAIIFDYHLKKDSSPSCTADDFIPAIRKNHPQVPIILTSASLTGHPTSQHMYDYFLQINASFWDELSTLIRRFFDKYRSRKAGIEHELLQDSGC